MSVFEIKDVSYSYDKSKKILTAVNAVFDTGKMYAILGVSGSGKTTLLSLLGGLDVPQKGEILFDGVDISEHTLEYHRRNHVSLIFQSYNLIDYMTPVENVKLTAKQDALLVLKQLGLTEDEAKRNVMKLSGGQQQRVAIARTLASDTPIILADEPTGNLDEDTAAEITEVLKNCAHQMNKCVIIVTHSNDLAKQADMVFRLKKGKSQPYGLTTGSAGGLDEPLRGIFRYRL